MAAWARRTSQTHFDTCTVTEPAHSQDYCPWPSSSTWPMNGWRSDRQDRHQAERELERGGVRLRHARSRKLHGFALVLCELKRRGIRTIAAVKLRIPEDEQVRVGHYGREPLDTTAVGAIRAFREHTSGLGLQVMIPRKIKPSEIMRLYAPPQGVGWRYYPEAKGRKPCGCEACQRGEIKSRRIREAYENE